MTSSVSQSHDFVICQNLVEPFRKTHDEDEIDALYRVILDRAVKGWEVVDVCGDEIKRPVFVFKKMQEPHAIPRIKIERLKTPARENEIAALTERLWLRLEEDWLPVCILHTPFTTPILVFKKSAQSCKGMMVKVVVVPIELFEKTSQTIGYELLDQQVKDNLTLACVVHGGLNPVLIMVSKDSDQPYQYLVEHAQGGIFRNQTRTLSELIESRSIEGWEVCGMFEDSFLYPCVIFRKPSITMPVVPEIEAWIKE